MPISKSSLRSQSGQGMIEYILVVTVSVIIIIMLVQKMYGPMDTFIQGIMGNYVSCLLETGELPALGSDSSSGECKPPIFAEDDAKAKDKKDANDNNSNARGKNLNDSDKVRVVDSGSGVGRSSGKNINIGRNATLGQDGAGGKGKTIDLSSSLTADSGSFYGYSGNGGSMYRKTTRYLAVSGEFAEEVKKKQEKQEAKTSSQKPDVGSGSEIRPKKLNVQPPPPKILKDNDNMGGGFDIGQIVKILLIAGIIIVIIVLLGGQALQLSKSWEKGE